MTVGKVVYMEFPIPKSLPSTDARYIDCAYRMDIVAAVEWYRHRHRPGHTSALSLPALIALERSTKANSKNG